MRFSFLTLLVSVRLAWGDLMAPLFIEKNFRKFFPPPRKAVFKKVLTNYFMQN